MQLDADQLDGYRRDGYVLLGQILDPAACEALIAAERRLRPTEAYGSSAGLIVMDQLANFSQEVREFCCNGDHLDAVEQLLGPDVVLTHNQFVTKLPDDGPKASEIPLHQDNGYGALDPPVDVTVWVTLVDTDINNGCLQVAPGSHVSGLVEHRQSAHNPAFREAGPVDLVPLAMKAGEAVAFSGLLLHGSGDNSTDAERAALFARYCHPDVVMVTEGGKPVLEDAHSWMVRGQASLAHWRSANDKFTAS
ncbi:MAG: phytanoyl-CoA dioxygenase family protein [Actinobacteria bacterium]|nr:phytanoyl-CoA dioxygenase family protein [Actinomycetota bacterium]